MPDEAPRLTIGRALSEAVARLSELPHSTPRLEAELLLAQSTGWSRATMLAWPEHEIPADCATSFADLLHRRLSGEPIAYLRGRQSFWSFDLTVTPATLIPRPETELIVEIALELLDEHAPLAVADLGTGSGAIAAAIGSERPAWSILATDQSKEALSIARENFSALDLRHIACARTSWLSALASRAFDAVLSNPPYIAEDDAHLRQGDLRFEPTRALASGPDGLDAIREIAAESMRCLNDGGLLVVEHGFDQGDAARAIFRAQGYSEVSTRRDLAGLERATLARR